MKQPKNTRQHQSISRGATWLALLLCLVLPLQPVLAGEITYYYPDATGSPVAATDAQGNILWREHYQPYGEKLNEPLGEDIGYTGHEFDAETGLTYMQARYYDPEVGRFLAIDPVGFKPGQPMTFNRYSYANNNPYKYVDPNGELVLLSYIIVTGAVLMVGAAIASNPDAQKEIAEAISNVVDTIDTNMDKRTEAMLERMNLENSMYSKDKGDTKEKAKDRRKKQRADSKENKHGDPNWEEPASESYVKWKAKQKEKASGKVGRRKSHDEKQNGEPDRSKERIDDDYK